MGLIGCVVLQGRAVQADALKVWIGSKCGLAQGVDCGLQKDKRCDIVFSFFFRVFFCSLYCRCPVVFNA